MIPLLRRAREILRASPACDHSRQSCHLSVAGGLASAALDGSVDMDFVAGAISAWAISTLIFNVLP